MLRDKIFRHSLRQENQIDVFIEGSYENFHGFWPLLDERGMYTEFIAVGNKDGIPPDLLRRLKRFKRAYGDSFKYIYNCQNGHTLTHDYSLLEREFDGIFDTDYRPENIKRLDCNHSMMVRSFPCDNLFWSSIDCEKEYDFNMLTVPKIGSLSKRWDRGEEVCYSLCKSGFKGVVYAQNGDPVTLVSERLRQYVRNGTLTVKKGSYSSTGFHEETCKALCTIFPNNIDAFPKFIIESLLADRFVVISDDLLLGRKVLNEIGEPVVTEINFKSFNSKKLVSKLLSLKNIKRASREAWLSRHDFKHVSKKWASEVNRLFDTTFSQLYFMNHIPRIQKCYERQGMVVSDFFDK